MKNENDVRTDEERERIQGSYDECRGEPAFIIADVGTDGAWLSISEGHEASVRAWR